MSPRRVPGRLLAVAVVVVALTGCAPETGTPAPGDGLPAFRDRAELPLCPAVTLAQGGEVPSEAEACLREAGAEGAELEVRAPTTEGDTVVTYYRVGPDIDGVELFVDATADRFGSGAWEHLRCGTDGSPLRPTDCTEVG